jgi:hypothetical protein
MLRKNLGPAGDDAKDGYCIDFLCNCVYVKNERKRSNFLSARMMDDLIVTACIRQPIFGKHIFLPDSCEHNTLADKLHSGTLQGDEGRFQFKGRRYASLASTLSFPSIS